DIDANGIVHVTAKDLGTGKEQSIKITASSGLTEEEIQRMIKDAEMHAEEDRKKKEVAELRNQLDTLIYTTEKSMREYGDKIDPADKKRLDDAISEAKKAMESTDASTIKRAIDELNSASHKLAEAMYTKATGGAQAGAGAAGGAETSQQQTSAGSSSSGSADEDVVDADFEEVKDKRK
ncbi:MAG: Hsp70 family protein, partial [Deltaproteobacteria bacterium]|nr:Hsp70 family protein [Deltaproteobacteria bacterium]